MFIHQPNVELYKNESVMLAHLPLNECYFAGANHDGIAPGKGCIVILHVPTGDIYNLSPLNGGRSLYLTRLINGREIPAHLEAQVRSLCTRAAQECGGALSPVHPESKIVANESIQGLSLRHSTFLQHQRRQLATR
jgi:hypothetical protein